MAESPTPSPLHEGRGLVQQRGSSPSPLTPPPHGRKGEELTFDYSSVTENEKEFKQAICLCGTRMCRGSFLYFLGTKAFTQVMNKHHTFIDRQVLLLRTGMEPMEPQD